MGKFVMTRAKDGEFMFNLVASNGEVVCTSQMYSSPAAARNGIDSGRRNAGAGIEDQTVEGYEKLKYPKWEVYEDKAGEAGFRMTASNGETINHRRRFFFFRSVNRPLADQHSQFARL